MPPIPPWPMPPIPPWPMPPIPPAMPPPIPWPPIPPWPIPSHSALSHAALAHAAHSSLAHLLTGLITCLAASLIAKARCYSRIVVGHATTVSGVVRPVPVRDVCSIELVEAVVIDVHIPIPPIDASPDRCAGEHARSKSVPATAPTRRVPIVWKVIGIRPRTVHHCGVVNRHEVFVRRGGDDLIRRRRSAAGGGHIGRAIDSSDSLLRRRLQVACCIGASPQALDSVEHIGLLRKKSVTEILRPFQLVIHHLQGLRDRGERFDARIPRLLLHGIFERLPGYVRIVPRPARCFDDFQWIGRRHEHLRQQIVRIERYRSNKLFELSCRQRCCSWTLLLRPHR